LSPVFGNFFEQAFAEIPSRYPNSAATLLNELERLDAPAVR